VACTCRTLSGQRRTCQKNHFSAATATHSHRLADWQAQQRNWGGPLHTEDAGNNAQNLFHAPLGLVHKQTWSLIQILATEVRI